MRDPDKPVHVFVFPFRWPPVGHKSEQHDQKNQLVAPQHLWCNSEIQVMRQLKQHGIDPVHIIRPEPDPGKGDKIKGDEDLPDVNENILLVLVGAYLLPQLINDQTYTVQPAPDDKLHVGPVPQTSQQHRDHQVNVGPPLTLSVTADRDIQVIL